MPYIKQDCRPKYEKEIKLLFDKLILYDTQAGDINYVISRIFWMLCNTKDGRLGSGISYSQANMLVGVLECVKLELYRRVIAPYEDAKAKENGDLSLR